MCRLDCDRQSLCDCDSVVTASRSFAFTDLCTSWALHHAPPSPAGLSAFHFRALIMVYSTMRLQVTTRGEIQSLSTYYMRPAASLLTSQLRQIERLNRPAPVDLSSRRAAASSAASGHETETEYTHQDHPDSLNPSPAYTSPVPSTPPPPYAPTDNLTVRVSAKLIEKDPHPYDSRTLHRWSKDMTMCITTSHREFQEAFLRIARGADPDRAAQMSDETVGMRINSVEKIRCCRLLQYKNKRPVRRGDWDGVMSGLVAGRYEGLAVTYWIDGDGPRTTAYGRSYLS